VLMVIFLVMNFQQKSSLNELLNTTLNQGDKIHLILINEYEEEAKKRSLTETEEKWLEDAVAYHRSVTAFQKQDYKSKYFFHYNKDLSITVAKVQKNELSEEKELFFYTKSRIYYTNCL